jgi:hypothetical protein
MNAVAANHNETVMDAVLTLTGRDIIQPELE